MRIRMLPVAAAGSFVAITALVVTTSSAAFTASTDNTGNSWTAGTLALSDDDDGTAMFATTAMRPGATTENCIAVTYNGTIAGGVPVTLHAATPTPDLAPYLDLTVERGTGGGFGTCTGFSPTETAYTGTVAGFAAAHSNTGPGAGTWSPAPGGTATYRFEATLRSEDAAQGLSAAAVFTWKMQDG